MPKDRHNRKDYSAHLFALLMVAVAAYIVIKDLGVLK